MRPRRITSGSQVPNAERYYINKKLYVMKKGYIIRTSEDGNWCYVYTNAKALYNGILSTNYQANYICDVDDNMKWVNQKMTYSNLVKALKKSTITSIYPDINGNGYGTIEIQEILISSK